MLKFIIALVLSSGVALAAPGKLQNADFATQAQITGAGGSLNQLLNTNKIWDTSHSQLLDVTLATVGGGVASVTASTPLASTGGSTPTISCQTATGAQAGCLSAADWNTFNGKGAGTVTAISINSSNGFAGSSSGGATPAITLSTSITGMLKGNGTAISAGTSGTDYAPGTSGLATGIVKSTTGTGVLSIATSADTIAQFTGCAGVDYLGADGACHAPAGAGTVTTMSVVTANGLAGTVANPTTTPAITLTTSITGITKGNGTALSAATSGTDYSAGTSGLATGILKSTTGTGALSIAASGTDYQAPISTNAGTTHQFFTAFTAPNTFTLAQPAFSDISGTTTASQLVVMVGDSGSGGTQGAVPAPAAGDAAAGKFLKADGTWAAAGGGGSNAGLTCMIDYINTNRFSVTITSGNQNTMQIFPANGTNTTQYSANGTSSCSLPGTDIPAVVVASIPAGTYLVTAIGLFEISSASTNDIATFVIRGGTGAFPVNGTQNSVACPTSGKCSINQVSQVITFAATQTNETFSIRAMNNQGDNTVIEIGDTTLGIPIMELQWIITRLY